MSATTPPPKERTSGAREPPIAHLACEPCKKRKVKCDREYPVCTTCRMFNRECVAVVRPRLPRGRKGGRKEASSELRARVNRLESLVQSLSKGGAPPETGPVDSSSSSVANHRQALSSISPPGLSAPGSSAGNSPSATGNSSEPRRMSKATQFVEGSADAAPNLGASLFETLSVEVDGIRAILEEPDEDDEFAQSSENGSMPTGEDFSQVAGTDLLGFSGSMGYELPEPGSPTCLIYARLFASNVDPVTRLAYLPAMRKHLETGAPYLDYPLQSPKLDALKAAIFYACTCSVTDDFCLEKFGASRASMSSMWKSSTEAALHRAEFLVSNDLAALQALVLYLYCIRTHDSSRTPWVLLAVAVRIAQSMSLHREETYRTLAFFHAEMCRRVWYRILDQDTQYAVDRGTDLLVNCSDTDTRRPRNINDEDMPPDRVTPCEDRLGLTENSHIVLCGETCFLVRKVNWVPPGIAKEAPGDERDTWSARLKAISEFKQFVQKIVVPGVKPTSFREQDTVNLARIICSDLDLWTVRPLQRHPLLARPPYPSATIMIVALQTLENHVGLNVFSEVHNPYRWCAGGYIPWHPFAVLVAELCQDHDYRLIERGWRVIDRLHRRLSQAIAEGASGGLWAPIKKLLRKAEMKRPPHIPRQDLWPLKGLGDPEPSITALPDIDMSMFDVNYSPSQDLLPAPEMQCPNGQIKPDPSWNEWSMFVDDLYTSRPTDGDLWMAPPDQQLMSSMSLSHPSLQQPQQQQPLQQQQQQEQQKLGDPALYPWPT